MRLWGLVLALSALTLPACNLLVSDEPWLEEIEDEGEPPEFKDGLWIVESKNCRVDVSAPVAEWPLCAEFLALEGGTWYTPEWENEPEGHGGPRLTDWTSQSNLLISGNPVMMEAIVSWDNKESEETRESPYVYFGLRPTASDKQGKVTAMRIWPARCGPVGKPTRRVSPDGKTVGSYVTTRPFPGLTIESYNCRAQNLEALKSAIRSSEALAGNARKAHWVRSGWK